VNSCNDIVEAYLEFLREGFQVHSADGECRLQTPFLDPSGDQIELLSSHTQDGSLVISDGGTTYDYLFMNGVSLNPSAGSRKDAIAAILSSGGCSLSEDGELRLIMPSNGNVGASLHALLRTVLATHDLVYSARPTSGSVFKEAVRGYLRDKQVKFEAEAHVPGKARARHRFDFLINRENESPVGIRALSTHTTSYARFLAVETFFAFHDVRQGGTPLVGIALIDDRANALVWEGEPLRILHAYSDLVARWTSRDQILSWVA